MKGKVFVAFGLLFLFVGGLFAFAGAQQETAMAEERPIWLYGAPAAGGGDYPSDVLALANEYMLEQFGHTFGMSSIPQGLSGPDVYVQALNLVIAEGKFPDVINLGGYNHYSQKMLADLARFDKIMPLDKYFNDPENYPELAKAGKNTNFMNAYKYNAQIYAHPGWNWRVEANEPAWLQGAQWMIRWELAKKFGFPQNTQDFYNMAKRVKAGNYTDLADQPNIPFGTFINPSDWTGVIYQMKGAGWEVTPDMKLIPQWASQETYESLKFFNQFWRDGLLNPQFFNLDSSKAMEYRARGTYAMFAGPTWYVNGPTNTMYSYIISDGNPKDSPEANKMREKVYVMMVPPVADPSGDAGRLLNYFGNVTVVSKDCPDPDAWMRVVDFLLSDEGHVTIRMNAGILGEDWEWADPPLYWKVKGSTEPGKMQTVPEDRQMGNTRSIEAAQKDPPRVLPWVHYFCLRTYARTDTYYASEGMLNLYWEQMGCPVGHVVDGVRYTVKEQEVNFCTDMNRVVSPFPSYTMVIYDMDPLEAGALATADQRWEEALADVLGADTPAEFESQYRAMLDRLLKVGNWKAIYEKRQRMWENWMEKNKVDDRSALKTVTARPEFTQLMGW